MEMLIFAVMVMVMIFSVAIIYPIMSTVLMENYLPTATNIMGNSTPSRSGELSTVTNLITQGWVWGPLIMIMGLIGAVYLFTGRREYRAGEY